MSSKPSVLVIGGGVAGVTLAQSLNGVANVTVVDRRDFYTIPYANVRTGVEPALGDKVNVAFKDIPRLGKFVQATVVKLTKTDATLDTGAVLKFDYACISTGSENSGGFWVQPVGTTLVERQAELRRAHEQIKAAKNIAVVGGGPVGIEIAAEILEAFAGKNVTLIHSGERLLDTKAAKMGNYAKTWLESHGGKVILKDRADKPAEGATTLHTKGGVDVQADIVLWTTGAKPNTAFLKNSELAAVVDAKGLIKVNESLFVEGYRNLLALGDVNNIAEMKLGYLANLQAELAAKNLAAIIAKGDAAKLGKWKPYNGMEAMFVSLGKSAGVGHLGGCICPSFMVGKMKSGDLFVGKARGMIGVKG